MPLICEQCGTQILQKDTPKELNENVVAPNQKVMCANCKLRQQSAVVDPDANQLSEKSSLSQQYSNSFDAMDLGQASAENSPLWQSMEKSAHNLLQGPSDAQIWYIAMNGVQVGPVNGKVIYDYHATQQINDDTLVYGPGFLGWVPLREAAELQSQLSVLRLSSSNFDSTASATTVNPSSLALRGEDVGDVEFAVKSDLDSPVVTESSLPNEHSFVPRVSRLSTFFPPPNVLGQGMWKWLAVTLVAGGMVGALAMYMVLSARPPKMIVKEKIVEKTEVVYRDAPLSGTNGDSAEINVAPPSKEVDKQHSIVTKKRTLKKETAQQRKQQLLAELSSQAESSGTGLTKGRGLSQKQVSAAVARNRSSLQLCYERSLKKGLAPAYQDFKVVFNVKVGTSGMVKSVSTTESSVRVPSLKKCLVGAVKRWMFPAGGQGSTVQFPIVFTPSR